MISSCSRQGAAEIELWSDFVKAIQEGNEAGVRQILESKATSNGTGNGSSFLTRKIKKPQGALTALHLAVMKEEEKIARLLIEKGSDVNAVDEHKRSPLHVAVEQENSIPIIQLLLNHKDININAIDEYKHTPIQLAAEKGNVEAVSALLKKGADITKEDIVQNTAIHVAAEKGNFKVLTVILPKADRGLICKLNKHRNTPLHLAVRRKCLKTVAVLLCYGADGSLEIKNEHGETPKDLASREREILELLQGNNSEKLKEILSTPCAGLVGNGCRVEADSPGHEAASQCCQRGVSNNALVTTLEAGASGIMPQVFYANTLNVKYEFKTDVHDGGVAAVGLGSQVNRGDFPNGATGHSQLVRPDLSTYNTNVSGGTACVGDKSVVNVGTGSPSRSPSTADSREGPWFLDHEDNGDNRGQGTSDIPLPYPVLENKSSGYPTENVSTPQELSHPIPENGKKASDCGINGELPYSIPEEGKEASGSNIDGKLPHPIPEEGKKERLPPNSGGLCCQSPEGTSSGIRTEIINELDTNGNDPAPVPEERRPGTAELVASASSFKDGKVTGKTLEKFTSEQSVTRATQSSVDKKSKEWLDLRDTSTTSTAAAASNRCAAKSSVRSEDISESQDRMTGPFKAEKQESEKGAHCKTPAAANSAASVTNQYVERPSGRLVDSVGAGNPVTITPPVPSEQRRAEPLLSSQRIQPLQTSGEEKAPRAGSEQPAGIQEKRPKSHNIGSQDEDTAAKGHGTSGNGGRLNRVGLTSSPGANTMFFEARGNDDSSASSMPCARGGGKKKLGASSRCSSFSKESSHRKEKFLRGASLPDKGTGEENYLQMVGPIRSTGTNSPVQDPSAGILIENEREERLVFTGNQRDERHSLGDINLSVFDDENSTLIRITDPKDDDGGKKSCNCRIF